MTSENCELCFRAIALDEKVCVVGGHVVCSCCERKSANGALRRMMHRAARAVQSFCAMFTF